MTPDDWLQGEVPLSKPPLDTTWAGVQAAALRPVGGVAVAVAAGSATAASAATVRALAATAVWGDRLTRNSFGRPGVPGLLDGGPDGWVCRRAVAGCVNGCAVPAGELAVLLRCSGDGCRKRGRIDPDMPCSRE